MVWFRISVGSVRAGRGRRGAAGAHDERERGQDRCERERWSTGHEVSPDDGVRREGSPGRLRAVKCQDVRIPLGFDNRRRRAPPPRRSLLSGAHQATGGLPQRALERSIRALYRSIGSWSATNDRPRPPHRSLVSPGVTTTGDRTASAGGVPAGRPTDRRRGPGDPNVSPQRACDQDGGTSSRQGRYDHWSRRSPSPARGEARATRSPGPAWPARGVRCGVEDAD